MEWLAQESPPTGAGSEEGLSNQQNILPFSNKAPREEGSAQPQAMNAWLMS